MDNTTNSPIVCCLLSLMELCQNGLYCIPLGWWWWDSWTFSLKNRTYIPLPRSNYMLVYSIVLSFLLSSQSFCTLPRVWQRILSQTPWWNFGHEVGEGSYGWRPFVHVTLPGVQFKKLPWYSFFHRVKCAVQVRCSRLRTFLRDKSQARLPSSCHDNVARGDCSDNQVCGLPPGPQDWRPLAIHPANLPGLCFLGRHPAPYKHVYTCTHTHV